jgi:ATP-dependent DNA helicase RecG
MTTDCNADYFVSLARKLCKLPHETEWVVLKANRSDPHEIGNYLSALTKAAVPNSGDSGIVA